MKLYKILSVAFMAFSVSLGAADVKDQKTSSAKASPSKTDATDRKTNAAKKDEQEIAYSMRQGDPTKDWDTIKGLKRKLWKKLDSDELDDILQKSYEQGIVVVAEKLPRGSGKLIGALVACPGGKKGVLNQGFIGVSDPEQAGVVCNLYKHLFELITQEKPNISMMKIRLKSLTADVAEDVQRYYTKCGFALRSRNEEYTKGPRAKLTSVTLSFYWKNPQYGKYSGKKGSKI